MKAWPSCLLLAWGVLSLFTAVPAQTIELFPDPAIPAAASVVDTLPGDSGVAPVAAPAPAPVAVSQAPRRPQAQPSVLYLGGGEGALWYHLGVLEAVERFRIPIDSVVGSSWGAWAGALWSAGWSVDDIAELATGAGLGLGDAQRAGQTALVAEDAGFPETFALAAEASGGVSGWDAQWRVTQGNQGAPRLSAWRALQDSAWNRMAWLRFRMQESLWREDPGRSIPFRAVLCFEDARTARLDSRRRVLESLPLPGNGHAGELCAVFPGATSSDSVVRIAAVAVPMRLEIPEDALWRREVYLTQLQTWELRRAGWVSVRPHHVAVDAVDSPEALRKLGFDAFKSRLGELSALSQRLRYYHHNAGSLPSKFVFQPVFDSVNAEYQGHLSSFWTADTGLAAPRKFFTGLADDAFYDSLALNMGQGADLLVRATAGPLLVLGAGGFGSVFHGLNGAGWLGVRWVDQFEYNARVEMIYGQTVRGFRPSLRLRRLWQGRSDFFVEGDLLNIGVLGSSLAGEPEEYRLLREERRDVRLGTDYYFDERSRLRGAVEIDNAMYWTGMRDWVNGTSIVSEELDPLDVSSLWLYVDGVDSSAHFEKWFATAGHRLSLDMGFRSVGVHVFGQNAAPLYMSSQGEFEMARAISSRISLGMAVAGGLDMRRGNGGRVLYPDTLEIVPDQVADPALGNRYRLRMDISPCLQDWWTSDNTSHHYGLVRGALTYHASFLGLHLLGGYVRDFERNPWSALGSDRLFLEPVARVRHRALDVRLGLHRQVALEEYSKLGSWKDYLYYLQLGSFAF